MYVEYGHVEPESRDRAELRALSEAMGFTQADLGENQRGSLSAGQRAGLLWRGAEMLGLLLMSVVPLIAFAALLLAVLAFGAELWMFGSVKRVLASRRPVRAVGNVVLMVWGIVTGVIVALFGLSGALGRNVFVSARLMRLARDLSHGRVARYSGRISTNRSEDFDDVLKRRQMTYYFCTKRRKYEVSQSAYDELEARGGSGFYTIYFTPGSHFLVAAEPATAAQVNRHASPTPRRREVA